MNESKLEIISGTNNIPLKAPHGHPTDDTGTLARILREQLDCSAAINEICRKPEKGEKEEGKDQAGRRGYYSFACGIILLGF
jgi:hypothetical protein